MFRQFCIALSALSSLAQAAQLDESALNITQYRADVKTLASDAFEGRAPLSAGEEKTVNYLIKRFKQIGLQPAFGDSYVQPVPLAQISADQSMTLRVGEMTFDNGTQFTARTQRISESVALKNSDIVFAGYGINAPEYNWNDYADIDVKGKTVVVLVNDPGFASADDTLFNGNAMTYYGRWTYKYEEAARQGAKALFIVHETMPAGYGWGVVQNSNTNTKYTLVDDTDNQGQVGVMGWLHLRAAEQLFADNGLDYRQMKKAATQRGFTPVTFKQKASLTLNNTIEMRESQNVAGIIPGTDAPDEWVMLHAHWDHLGKAMENGKEVILNGAVDNASGVGGVLALADYFVDKPARRTMMFSAFTAEETGLIGSEHFAKNPPVAHKNLVAFLNIDGMNMNDKVDYTLQYGQNVSDLEQSVAKIAKQQGRGIKMDPRPQNGLFFRSDHFALAKEGIPSYLFMSLGDTDPDFIANRYHKSGDDYMPDWSLGGVKQDLALIGRLMQSLAASDDWPQWTGESDFKTKRDKQR